MTSLDNEGKIRGERAAVTRARSLLVGVGRGHVVGQLARALEHLALVVGAVGVLDLLGHRLDLIYGVRHTDKIAPGNAVERVASSADLTVNLVPPPDAGGRVRSAHRNETEFIYLAWSNESSNPECGQGY